MVRALRAGGSGRDGEGRGPQGDGHVCMTSVTRRVYLAEGL